MLKQALIRVCMSAALTAFVVMPLAAQDIPRVEIIRSIAHGVTPAQRDLPPQAAHPLTPVVPVRKPSKPGRGGGGGGGGGGWTTDPDLTAASSTAFPGLLASFGGVGANGSIPPDTNLAAGATQVLQTVNTEYAVYDKAGNLKLGPTAIHSIFAGLANATSPANMCATSDGGDPIVMYDQMAGRWFVSQLQYNSSFTTNLICIGVSTTSDATGSYNVWAFNFGGYLPDYPKFGVWPDAYYLSANMFYHGASFSGAKACAFDRTSMINYNPATPTTIWGWCYQNSTGVYSLLPANLDGQTQPASGEPDFFVQFTASSGVGNTLALYKLKAGDFSTCTSSGCSGFSFAGPTNITVGQYHEACGGGTCVPQPGTGQQLDSLADRLMYRLQYRSFPATATTAAYESLVVNHSVQVSSTSNQTGVRWYEIRNPNATPSVAQQGTYSPDSVNYRWMGSIAQDKAGNMALGYSYSSSNTYPSIYAAVRAAGDTANTLGQESLIHLGGGSQTSYSRWGDYSSMAMDPVDDCTFWYTTEYLPSSGNFNWNTWIASFKFSTCQ